MNRYLHVLMTLGLAVLLILLEGVLGHQGEVRAEPLDFNFTYTSDDTVEFARVETSVKFQSLLTNTGTEADTYDIYLTENPPTPEEWWVGVCFYPDVYCWDTTQTHEWWYLESAQWVQIELEVLPRTAAKGSFTFTVVSRGNPGVKLTKSLTFHLTAAGEAPLIQRWGLVIMAMLILTSGFYLMYRRVKLGKQNKI